MPFSGPEAAAAFMASLISSLGHVARRHDLEVDDADIRRRHPHGRAVKLALQRREHQPQRLGRTG